MQGKFTWAMAGRSKEKLEQVKADLATYNQQASDVALLQADISDDSSLDKLAASASVIISTVGPYAKYGRPVIKVRLFLVW
jgi:short subunit dehydrogenase-like uncharacterized protein